MRRSPRATAVLVTVLLLTVPLAGCLDALPLPEDFVMGQTWPREMTGIGAVQGNDHLTGAGVTVAVIDTGIAPAHPEFEGVDIVAWKDYVGGKAQPYDDNGHGTHVASIIVAQGTYGTVAQGFRLRGAAPGADLIVVKAISSSGRGEESDVAKGIDFAVQNGADIVVLSLGGGTFPVLGTDTERAVNRAVDQGVYVVAAAGNKPDDQDSCNGVSSPGNVRSVITVGAVDEKRSVPEFSCRGTGNDPNQLGIGGRSDPHKKPEIVAPGANILAAWHGGSCGGTSGHSYCQASGTSQAVPYVAATLALLLQDHPELKRGSRDTIEQVKERLMASAEKVGPLAGKGASAHDDAYGYGLLRADKLIAALR